MSGINTINYDQIKRGVESFKEIVSSYGIFGYYAIGSLLLECCLKDHGIGSELVKGYIVIEDTYWVLHIWNKLYLPDDKVRQLDVVRTPSKEMGFRTQYTFVLNNKWKSVMDTEELSDHDSITEFFKRYQKDGYKEAINHLSAHRDRSVDGTWISIFDHIAHLKTFRSAKNCKSVFETL